MISSYSASGTTDMASCTSDEETTTSKCWCKWGRLGETDRLPPQVSSLQGRGTPGAFSAPPHRPNPRLRGGECGKRRQLGRSGT